jgi:hypothetical protein
MIIERSSATGAVPCAPFLGAGCPRDSSAGARSTYRYDVTTMTLPTLNLSRTRRVVFGKLWAAKRHYTPNADADPSYLLYCLCGPPPTRFVADAG